MTLHRRHLLRSTAASVLLAGLARQALAQAQVEVLRVVSSATAGDIPANFCRRIAERLAPGYARAISLDHMSGSEGQAAIEFLTKAAPDGATCLQTSMSALAIYPLLHKNLGYDPLTDLSPVSLGCAYDFGLAVGPSVPASVGNVAEFLAWAKANPTKSGFGSPALGSVPHLIGALLARSADVPLKHQAYAGAQPAIQELIGGQIAAVIAPVGEFTRYVMTGRCRLIATSGAKRSPFAFTGQIATFTEQGLPDFAFNEWLGFYLPARVAPGLVSQLNAVLRGLLGSPITVAGLAVMGVEALSSTPAEQTNRLKADIARWGPLVKVAGLAPA